MRTTIEMTRHEPSYVGVRTSDNENVQGARRGLEGRSREGERERASSPLTGLETKDALVGPVEFVA